MTFVELLPAAPEITLLTMICVVLIADLMISDEKRVITFWLSIAGLAVTGWSLLASAPAAPTLLFDGSYISDSFSQVLKLAAVGFVALGFLYARDYLKQNDLLKGEYYLLGMFGLLT